MVKNLDSRVTGQLAVVHPAPKNFQKNFRTKKAQTKIYKDKKLTTAKLRLGFRSFGVNIENPEK